MALISLVILATCAESDRSGGAVGRVCSSGITGKHLAAISEAGGRCGLRNPVEVHQVLGVNLSRPAIMDCRTARALKTWVRSALKPTFDDMGGGVTGMSVFDDYSCRSRNNARGARPSLHATGQAIDIGGFTLADGSRISVLSDWRDSVVGRKLQALHRSACGPFGTVLGPNYNRAHANHLHFDTDSYGRGGRFCR